MDSNGISTKDGAQAQLRHLVEKCVAARSPDEGGYIAKLHQAVIETDEIMAALGPLLEDRVTMGQKVKQFEHAFAKRFGLENPVMSNSGSSANLLALSALCSPAVGILEPGDEVILPALLWSTTIWPVIQCGLVPVVVDIDPETLNIDPAAIERAIAPGKTKAIMLVHIMGNPCAMNEIMAIAERHGLAVIEDCCEAMGSLYRGKPVGSFGVVSSFSFYYSHHITTIEGGMNCTSNVEVADRMRIMRAHGWSRDSIHTEQVMRECPGIDPRWLFVDLGYNFRPTELNAAMGLVQLGRVDHVVGQREANGAELREKLSKYKKHLSFQRTTPDCRQSWFYLPIIVRKDAPFKKEEMTEFLEKNQIETRPLLTGNILRQPAMKFLAHKVPSGRAGDGSVLPVADWITTHGFAIGIHSEMTTEIKAHIVSVIDKFMVKYVV